MIYNTRNKEEFKVGTWEFEGANGLWKFLGILFVLFVIIMVLVGWAMSR